ncbi:Uncharacterised protein [Candidatus Tiddalikarchaeum anstoanum]|nr:Uncharacterised protein [Candidatus Tiddalikarchaeum anstoanum]
MKLKGRFVIEAMGIPDLLVKTLNGIADSIKKTYTVSAMEVGNPEKTGDKFHTSFLEITVEFKNIQSMVEFMMNYTPTFVEVLEPYKMELTAGELEEIANSFMTKLHDYDKSLKSVAGVNKLLTRKLQERNTK